jgi:hypothetical protein
MTPEKYFTLTELVHFRRWKRSAVTAFLGRPDRVVPVIHKQPAQLFAASRLMCAELLHLSFRKQRRGQWKAGTVIAHKWIG